MGNVVSLKIDIAVTNLHKWHLLLFVALVLCVTHNVLLYLCCDDDTTTMKCRRTGLSKLTSWREIINQPVFLIH